jgi:hypothetical protein
LRSQLLPAEVILSWDPSAGAAYYRVRRAKLDRRWAPVTQVLGTRLRDGDFYQLPTYYQVIAYNEAGEAGPAAECLVLDGSPYVSILGVNPRPVSDTSFAISWNLDTYGDALLEVGTSLLCDRNSYWRILHP